MNRLARVFMALFLVMGFAGVAMAEIDSQSGGTDLGTATKINFSTGLTATRSGLVTTVVANSNGTNAAITSGTINGAVIGGSTPAAGTFTTLTATQVTRVKVALTPGSTVALDASAGSVFTLTPAQTTTINTTGTTTGQVVYLIVTTSGTQTYTITFGTGFKSTGTLATGGTTAKVFVVEFVSDGTTLTEVGRTAAM